MLPSPGVCRTHHRPVRKALRRSPSGDPGRGRAAGNRLQQLRLNDCPAELWSALDAQAIAAENGAATALLNGPRYWLMNAIEKATQGPRMIKNFGGIDMVLQAHVLLSGMNPAPYTANQVNRHTVFTFDAGEEVYELHDPALRRWVMQTWSQIVDPNLSRADLPGLGDRLDLPDGMDLPDPNADQPVAHRHHHPRRAGAAGRPDQQLFAAGRLSLTGTDRGWTRCRWPVRHSSSCR